MGLYVAVSKMSEHFTWYIGSFNPSNKDNYYCHFADEEPSHREVKTLPMVAQWVSRVSEIQTKGSGSPALNIRYCQV